MQYSDRGVCFIIRSSASVIFQLEMSQLSFDHLLNLSFGWHMKRKTGEVLRILDRGSVINRSLEVNEYFAATIIISYDSSAARLIQHCPYFRRHSYSIGDVSSRV